MLNQFWVASMMVLDLADTHLSNSSFIYFIIIMKSRGTVPVGRLCIFCTTFYFNKCIDHIQHWMQLNFILNDCEIVFLLSAMYAQYFLWWERMRHKSCFNKAFAYFPFHTSNLVLSRLFYAAVKTHTNVAAWFSNFLESHCYITSNIRLAFAWFWFFFPPINPLDSHWFPFRV